MGACNYFECERCDYKSLVKSYLKRYVRSVHDKVKQMEECKLCNIMFLSKALLKNHNRFNHELIGEEETVKCSQCTYESPNLYRVKRHISQVHQKIRINYCPVCNGSFSSKGNLRAHMRRKHTNMDVM